MILERICEITRMEDNYKRSILSIFYAFFIDTGKEISPIIEELIR